MIFFVGIADCCSADINTAVDNAFVSCSTNVSCKVNATEVTYSLVGTHMKIITVRMEYGYLCYPLVNVCCNLLMV